MASFGDFLRPVFTASRVQHVSDLHPKFAQRPHHVWKYGRHPIADGWLQLLNVKVSSSDLLFTYIPGRHDCFSQFRFHFKSNRNVFHPTTLNLDTDNVEMNQH